MIRKKVGVVCGGYSSEHKISIESGETVFSKLDRKKWEPFLIIVEKSKWSGKDDRGNIYSVSKGDLKLTFNEKTIKIDLIFNLIHGSLGENGQLAALCEILEIPISSCDSYNAALTFNKRDCLSVLREWKIPTAKYFTIDKGDDIDVDLIIKKLGLPCFVKANRSGSSFGIFKVYDKLNLIPSIKEAFKYDTQLIIESNLNGLEVSVGTARYENEIQVFPITEIIPNNDFFDYAAKYEGQSEEITPARIEKSLENELVVLSKKIYSKLGLKGFVRTEFIIVDKIPHILEINSVPGMTEKSIIPQQIKAMKTNLSDFLSKILIQTIE